MTYVTPDRCQSCFCDCQLPNDNSLPMKAQELCDLLDERLKQIQVETFV